MTYYHNLVVGMLDASMSLNWYREYGDTSNYIWRCTPDAITIDANGDLYVCGYFGQYFYLQSGPAANGGFTARFNPNNGNIIGARSLCATNNTGIFWGGANYDLDRNIIYAGCFYGTIDFGGVVLDPYSAAYNSDIFIVAYDTSGQLDWIIQCGYSRYEWPQATRINHGRFGCIGSFQDSLTIGGNTVYQDTITNNCYYFFTAVTEQNKISAVSHPIEATVSFSVFPNPTSDVLIFNTSYFHEDFTASVYSSNGELILTQASKIGNTIDVSMLAQGTYYLTLTNGYVSISKPFVKQ